MLKEIIRRKQSLMNETFFLRALLKEDCGGKIMEIIILYPNAIRIYLPFDASRNCIKAKEIG